jgi:hypothetical protein
VHLVVVKPPARLSSKTVAAERSPAPGCCPRPSRRGPLGCGPLTALHAGLGTRASAGLGWSLGQVAVTRGRPKKQAEAA